MLDEELLAGALSAHIDAILAGQPLPLEDGPEELRQLLDLADQLAAIDLPPRPAFDQRIRQSLSGRGGNGGLTRLGNLPLLLVLGLVALIGIIGVVALTATLLVPVLLLQRDRLPTSTPRALSTISAPLPTSTPRASATISAPTPVVTPRDTIQPSPASTTDNLILKATPSPAFPYNLGGQSQGGQSTHSHTDANSGGDSDDDDDEDD